MEHASFIKEKWRGYQAFLRSRPEFFRNKRIICLFILENVSTGEKRYFNVLSTIDAELYTYVGSDFDIFIAPPKVLIDGIIDGFKDESKSICDRLRSAGFYSSKPVHWPFGEYLYHSPIEGKINKINGMPQEFFLDTIEEGVRIIKRVLLYNQLRSQEKSMLGRTVPYIVGVKDEAFACKIVKYALSNTDLKDVYFTSVERAREKGFPNCLFTIGYSEKDNCYFINHIDSIDLKKIVYEKKTRVGK